MCTITINCALVEFLLFVVCVCVCMPCTHVLGVTPPLASLSPLAFISAPVPGQHQGGWEGGRCDHGPAPSASTKASDVRWHPDPWQNRWGRYNRHQPTIWNHGYIIWFLHVFTIDIIVSIQEMFNQPSQPSRYT